MDSTLTFLITISGAIVGGLIAGRFSMMSIKKAHEHQKEIAEDNQKILIKSLLQAIHDEMESFYDRYNETMGNRIDNLQLETPLYVYYPIMTDYFSVFHGNTAFLGRIQDHDLRKGIIRSYVLAKGLLDSYKMNNDIISKHEYHQSIYTQNNHFASLNIANEHMRNLTNYAKTLKKSHDDFKKEYKNTIRMLLKHGVLSSSN